MGSVLVRKAADEGMAGWRLLRGYADNVGLATALAVMDERAVGQVYNVGEPAAFAEAEWVRMVGQAAGWGGEVVVVPKDQLPAHLGSISTQLNITCLTPPRYAMSWALRRQSFKMKPCPER